MAQNVDWPAEETEAAATTTTGGDGTTTQHLWEESWDDDDTTDDFSTQLRFVDLPSTCLPTYLPIHIYMHL